MLNIEPGTAGLPTIGDGTQQHFLHLLLGPLETQIRHFGSLHFAEHQLSHSRIFLPITTPGRWTWLSPLTLLVADPLCFLLEKAKPQTLKVQTTEDVDSALLKELNICKASSFKSTLPTTFHIPGQMIKKIGEKNRLQNRWNCFRYSILKTVSNSLFSMLKILASTTSSLKQTVI